MKILFLILISGFSMQVIKYFKKENKFNQMISFLYEFNNCMKENDLEKFIRYLNPKRYIYDQLIVKPQYISTPQKSLRPLEFLSKSEELKYHFPNLLDLGSETLELELNYNFSYWEDVKNKEFFKLFNPINYIWNFFDFIYEPIFERIDRYGKALVNFLGMLSTILTTYISIQILLSKLGFDIKEFLINIF